MVERVRKKRTTVLCYPQTREKIKEMALKQGKKMAQIVKEGVDLYLKHQGEEK